MSFIMLAVTGCATKQGPIAMHPQKRSLSHVSEEELARLHDIPFPFNAQIEKFSSQTSRAFTFLSSLSQSSLIDFYRSHMAAQGWHESGVQRDEETCLVFVKPTKYCILTLRLEGDQQRIVIFLISKIS